MSNLNQCDLDLIKAAQDTISKIYDSVNYNHTVASALRCKNGKIYLGVNLYSLHGVCGEQMALGNAIIAGEHEFISIVAVRGANGEEILPPCGNCRQILADYAPNCEVIISFEDKVSVKELLPYAYKVIV
ncbi:MAG: hypothetical protein RR382_06695 [Tannerellaceae bacterium]